ncbi:unnamed protein product [Gordionus sp. m RMFG-2023]
MENNSFTKFTPKKLVKFRHFDEYNPKNVILPKKSISQKSNHLTHHTPKQLFFRNFHINMKMKDGFLDFAPIQHH